MAETPGLGGRAQADLRRLITLSFSAGELLELAASLGTPMEGDVARELVRRAPPEVLLSRLRDLRPLVEWPELEVAAPPGDPGSRAGTVTVVASPSLDALASLPAPAAREGGSDTSGPPGALPRHLETASTLVDEPTALSARDAPAPRRPLPIAAPGSSEKKPSGVDPRLFAAVGVLTLVAGLIAFVAGRSFRQGGKEEPRISMRKDGPTARAKGRFEKSLFQVARDCEIVGGKFDEPTVFDRALERCGKDMARPKPAPEPRKPETSVLDLPPEPEGGSSAAPNPASPPSSPSSPSSSPSPRPPATSGGGPQPPKPTGGPKPPRPAGEPDKGCVSRCESGHRTCKSACGAEPQQASQYQAFQGCLSRCLASTSQCRIGCGR